MQTPRVEVWIAVIIGHGRLSFHRSGTDTSAIPAILTLVMKYGLDFELLCL